jgi:hypothetical protein
MKIKTISAKAFFAAAAKSGIKPLPEGHRFFSEGPSIHFLSRTPTQSVQKATDFPQKDSQEESATLKKS